MLPLVADKDEYIKSFSGDTAYVTQLKQQKSKRGYYFGAR